MGDKPAILRWDWVKWYEKGKKGNKPIILNKSGSLEEYWVNDKQHRRGDKPAVYNADSSKEWRINDKLHRENDKPAVIEPDGTKYYYKNNRQYYPKKK